MANHSVPQGFRLTGVHCGIKADPQKEDLTLIVCDEPATAAGVYTQNLVHAASVARNRSLTPLDELRTVVVNSGNANACTGERGERDNEQMARLAAEACGADLSQALSMSTGIIGEFLPMDRLAAGVKAAAAQLGDDAASLELAARGMMTTDKRKKIASTTLLVDGREVTITGFAKGAGMIGPKMATMLAVIMTDAPLSPDLAQEALQEAVDVTFNCISVEGHMSTSDTVLLLASGASGGATLDRASLAPFVDNLIEVCTELARAIPADGEGASHLIQIDVSGLKTREDAQQIAKTVANSALVKTAVAGADPNWGRIVSAAGYSGVDFNPGGVDLSINGLPLYEKGAPIAFDVKQLSASMRGNYETRVDLRFSEGDAAIRFWTSDLTVEYIKINTDEHT
ncbi:MAG: bifunctional glutamate N-acetyltransferase/amino-acid acetyltransferase ArgJ [Pirellulaceae bacterium]